MEVASSLAIVLVDEIYLLMSLGLPMKVLYTPILV